MPSGPAPRHARSPSLPDERQLPLRRGARQAGGEIYGWFTEGNDIVDLKEAKALLGQLRGSEFSTLGEASLLRVRTAVDRIPPRAAEGHTMTQTTVLLDSLVFPEGPRWHDGWLWFSDMHAGRVMRVSLDGQAETVVDVPGLPSGLGWLPAGRLLIVSMTDRRLLRFDPDGLRPVADLGVYATSHCNDMVVDGVGRAYVGNFGFDFWVGAPPCLACLMLVTPDGAVRVATEDLAFPNGMVITLDGRTLVVAETFAERLTAFDVAPDGSLDNRRVWAQLPGIAPDGICLDAAGAIWVASPLTSEVVRVSDGGAITARVAVDRAAYACMLGGPDRRTLFVLTALTHEPETVRTQRAGRVECVRVEVPGTGWP